MTVFAIRDIDPQRAYTLQEAAKLLPSLRAGGAHLKPATLSSWIRSGRLRGYKLRTSGMYARWFVLGADLLALFEEVVPEPTPEESRTIRHKQSETTLQRLRDLGMNV